MSNKGSIHYCGVHACRYAKESKVLFKVAGYADSAKQEAGAGMVGLHGHRPAGMCCIVPPCSVNECYNPVSVKHMFRRRSDTLSELQGQYITAAAAAVMSQANALMRQPDGDAMPALCRQLGLFDQNSHVTSSHSNTCMQHLKHIHDVELRGLCKQHYASLRDAHDVRLTAEQRHVSSQAVYSIVGSPISALHALVGFMAGLNNADADGRVILDSAAGTLKFLLLNAAAHFSEVPHPSQQLIRHGSPVLLLQLCIFLFAAAR